MSSTLESPADRRAAGLTAIRATVVEMEDKRRSWERDVTALFDDFDSLAVRLAVDTTACEQRLGTSEQFMNQLAGQQDLLARQHQTTTAELSAMRQMIEQQTQLAGQQDLLVKQQQSTSTELSAVRHMIEQQTQLAGQQDVLTKQQQTTTSELSSMRHMIEQQTELLAAFVGAATQLREPGKPGHAANPADPVVNAVQAQFSQLSKPPAHEIRAGTIRPGLVRAG